MDLTWLPCANIEWYPIASPQCSYKPNELDHSMVLVGWGSDAAGDYW